MASVYEVYNIIKDLTNKDERGMITPAQFNSFAGVAQQKVYNNLFKELQDNKRLSIRQVDAGGDKNRVKQIQEDLSAFSKSVTIAVDGSTAGLFQKPENLARIISMTTNDDNYLNEDTLQVESRTKENISIVYDEAKLDMILRSTLSAPSVDSPVALVSRDILVFPTTIENIITRYYKTPEGIDPMTDLQTPFLPKFGHSVDSNGVEVYQVTESVDFELPSHYVPELVVEISKLVGINLRQADVLAYAQGEEQKKFR